MQPPLVSLLESWVRLQECKTRLRRDYVERALQIGRAFPSMHDIDGATLKEIREVIKTFGKKDTKVNLMRFLARSFGKRYKDLTADDRRVATKAGWRTYTSYRQVA
jgi:hypothetical protein